MPSDYADAVVYSLLSSFYKRVDDAVLKYVPAMLKAGVERKSLLFMWLAKMYLRHIVKLEVAHETWSSNAYIYVKGELVETITGWGTNKK